jgi:hypothetical protein
LYYRKALRSKINVSYRIVLLADAVATGRDALPRDPASHVQAESPPANVTKRGAETAKRSVETYSAVQGAHPYRRWGSELVDS